MVLGGLPRTSLHLCHDWCGWCFLQYQFLSGQGLHSLIQGRVFSVQKKVCRRSVVPEAEHALKLLALKLQQYLHTGLSERISLLLADPSYRLLWIFYVAYLFHSCGFVRIISLWFHVRIPLIYCWKQRFLCCLADEYPFWYVCVLHCLRACMKF